MWDQRKVKPCRFCNEKIAFDESLNVWCNLGTQVRHEDAPRPLGSSVNVDSHQFAEFAANVERGMQEIKDDITKLRNSLHTYADRAGLHNE
jgi:hypothetical protein